jgi:hypothetical protein
LVLGPSKVNLGRPLFLVFYSTFFLLLFSWHPRCKIPEGIVEGFQNFAWAFIGILILMLLRSPRLNFNCLMRLLKVYFFFVFFGNQQIIISAHADGGPRSHRSTPHRHEQEIFRRMFCRVTFKHLSLLRWSHTLCSDQNPVPKFSCLQINDF